MTTPVLDHDFHNKWGTILGVTELNQRPMATALWKEYWDDPINVERNYDRILACYMDEFATFFKGIHPISFHGHGTDAMSPTTIASMFLRLAIFAKQVNPDAIIISIPEDRPSAMEQLGWNAAQVGNPRWAVVKDSYAAGFGPLATVSAQPAFQDIATGAGATSLQLVNRAKQELSERLRTARQEGCIGVIVEIVNNQYSGRVTTPSEMRNLSEACAENGLLLVVDETVTSIRCGAPFAYQRPEYGGMKPPDLVIFGKALAVSGIGINFEGSVAAKLGIVTDKHRRQAILNWQTCVTQAVQTPVLINALGVLEMAKAGDWVRRSRVIGEHLRETVRRRAGSMLDGSEESETFGGLDSFLFVKIEVSGIFFVMGASNAGPWVRWVRWLPRMDKYMTSRSTVETILGPASLPHRRERARQLAAQELRPEWCFWCGNHAQNQVLDWCRECCIHVCNTEECSAQLIAHKCLTE